MTRSALFPFLLSSTDFIALDVGASHWLPDHWRPYQSEFDFVLVEPDADACKDLVAMAANLPGGSERYRVVMAAVSGGGGQRTLYRTNAPTGSSLLEPNLAEDDIATFYRYPAIDNPSYFLPLKKIPIDTVTLETLLRSQGVAGFHMIKLDTQGTELEIVLGLGQKLDDTVCVEMEVGDHELYRDKPDLAATLAAMNARGFRLYDMKIARDELIFRGSADPLYSRHIFASGPNGDAAFVARIHEVDAVFIRDPLLAIRTQDSDALRRIMVAMCVYRLFADAYQITGLGEMAGLWDGITASRYRRDIIRAHQMLRSNLDRGVRLYWEKS